ncbi:MULTISPECIES: ABC transporter substrate-binding protein [unclassified Brevibacterium]|uniref:ABC transporter substrate-binding protein n=1 Tax=unclassified Brevibacterium TaxID=2614124 RepID=UPI000C693F0B|nr:MULTISPECIES: ABC transporter substrate-binding protein [unclassified Brevibacterium]SMX67465.1 peptide/nickel transport system substrate-binding protein [Brevibacterium sp. 239c]
MKVRLPRRALAIGSALALTFGLAACSGGDKGGGEAGDTIVAETAFNLKTIDPHRQFEFTGSTIDTAIYQTALEFKDGDLTKPTDGLCSFEMSDDNKKMTLKLKEKDAKFSNGDPVTMDDVVFSFERLKGIKGNPSFFLDGVTIKKVDDETVELTSKKPNPALPYILPNASIGIVNSKVVKENEGTTDEKDGAEAFLNENSQGSGPYKVDKYDADSQVVLTANEHYNGPKPKFKRVVLRNVSAETQLTDIQSGQAQVAYDLNADQAKQIDDSMGEIASLPSTRSLYIFNNTDEKLGGPAADPNFRKAVMSAIDYDKLTDLAGEGSQRMASLVPNEFIGAVPKDQAPEKDLAKTKKLLKKAGYKGEKIPFHYSSDQAVNGVDLAQLAETLQAQLKEAGINLALKPAPSSTQLDGFRSAKQPMGIGTWGADYPDPTNYNVFIPGGSVADRVNWDSDPKLKKLAAEAEKATDSDRDAAYAKLYKATTDTGVWIPLVQPVNTVAVGSSINKYVSNADISFDFAKAE